MAKKIVTLGGGTGSSVLLYGLKKYIDDITAIVTVADDGGSSGMLREDLGMLPPGDIRACLVALSNSEEEMEELMRFRFDQDSGSLAGQSFGNLFLAALSQIHGSFDKGLKAASKVLNLRGKVLPMSLDNITLYAELEDGSIIQGESNISFLTRKSGSRIKSVFIKPPLTKPPVESIDELMEADLVVLGPGSLYTSVMPNLLVEDLRNAVIESPGKKIYICNIMTQPGETDDFTPYDHLKAIVDHCGQSFIDYIFINNQSLPAELEIKYKYENNSHPVIPSQGDLEKIIDLGTQPILGNFLDTSYGYVKHNSDEITRELLDLL